MVVQNKMNVVYSEALANSVGKKEGYWKLVFVQTEMKRTMSDREREEEQSPPEERPPEAVPVEKVEDEESIPERDEGSLVVASVVSFDYEDCKLVYADPPWPYARTAGQGVLKKPSATGWRYTPMSFRDLAL